MGRTQCFKANVAYSLYGILKNDNDYNDNNDNDNVDNTAAANACRKDTYINSFFTTFGVESFAGPLGFGVNTANSYCTAVAPNDENNMYLNDDAAYADVVVDDDYLDDGNYQFYNYAAYSSYGTGCSADGSFVTDAYSGAFCHGSNYLETTNTLDSFNQAMESLECTQIYDASNNSNNNNNNNNNNGRQLENNNNNNNQNDIDFEELQAVYILAYSKSCSLRQYPQDCPDPFGLKKKYANQMNAALAYKTGANRDIGTKLIKTFTSLSFMTGVFFLLISLVLHRRNRRRFQLEKRKAIKRNKKKRKGGSKSAAAVASSSLKTTTTMSAEEDTKYDNMDRQPKPEDTGEGKSSPEKQQERKNRLWPFRGRSSPIRKSFSAVQGANSYYDGGSSIDDGNTEYSDDAEQQQQQQHGGYYVAPDVGKSRNDIAATYSQPIVSMNQSQEEETVNTDTVEQQARSGSSGMIQDLLNTSGDAMTAAVVAATSCVDVSGDGSETPIQATHKPKSMSSEATKTVHVASPSEEEAPMPPRTRTVETFTATTTETVDKQKVIEEVNPPVTSATARIKYMQIDASTPATTYTYSEEESPNRINTSFQNSPQNKSNNITSNSSFDDSLYSPNTGGGDGSMTSQRTTSRMVGQEVIPDWTTFDKPFGGDSPPRRLHGSSLSSSSSSLPRATKRWRSKDNVAAAAAAAPDDWVPFESDGEGDVVMNKNKANNRRTGSGGFVRSLSRNFFRKHHG